MRLSLQQCIYLCCSDHASPRRVLRLQLLRLSCCYCEVLMFVGAQCLMTANPYSWREGNRDGCFNTAYMLIFPNLHQTSLRSLIVDGRHQLVRTLKGMVSPLQLILLS